MACYGEVTVYIEGWQERVNFLVFWKARLVLKLRLLRAVEENADRLP